MSSHLLSTYQMPGPVQRAFHLLAHLIFTTSLEVGSGFMPVLQMKILRNSDSWPLVQSPKADKKRSQGLNPGSHLQSLSSEPLM